MKSGLILLAPTAMLTGCGAPNNGCTGLTSVLQVAPASATVSSSATAPGNQTQFQASLGFAPNPPGANCAIPQILTLARPAWSNPDPVHITISSAQDESNGVAVCKGPTGGPVTLTASTTSSGSSTKALTSTVQLTCQ